MDYENSNQIIFREIQSIRSPWIWGLIMIPLIVIIYGMLRQLFFEIPWGNNPMSNIGLLIVGLILIIGSPLFIYFIRLEIQVRGNGVYYRFSPFHLRFQRILLDNLRSYQVIHYRPLRDYGGWGIRYGKYGKAYTLSGNIGIQLVTVDHKKFLLGTNKPDDVKNALDSIQKNTN